MSNLENDKSHIAEREDPLRYAFVEMLFALAVSQVAIHTADFLSTTASPLQLLPVATHLVLSLLVIGTSWIGWRQSRSPGMKQQIQSIFSRRAIGLLLDVLLVILYFILVRSVELQQKDGNTVLTSASVAPESKWLACIFMIYIVWDLLADVFSPNCLTETEFWKRFFQGIRVSLVSIAASSICLCMTLIVFFRAEEMVSPNQVALLDLGLMMIVFLFRVLKVYEHGFANLLGVDGCQAFSSARSGVKQAKILTFGFIIAFAGILSVVPHLATH